MIITRYLTREVSTALLGVVTVLLLAFLSQQVVRYLNYVAIGKIPTTVLLQLVSFEVPYLLAILLPLALYLGILLAYGRMHADNEMSILQLSGFDDQRLLRLTGVIALSVAGIIFLLMLWINPLISAKRQQIMQSDEATLHLIQTLIPGRFQVSPDGKHVMYVEKLSRDHQRASNVFIARAVEKNGDLPTTWAVVSAEEGYQSNDILTDDPFFVTAQGYRYEGVPGQNDYKIIQYKRYGVRIPQNELRVSHVQTEALNTGALLSDYSNPKRAAEFQWRISIGISALLLALLAVPLSKVQPRHGRYLMILPAVIIYILYVNLLFVSRHWVESGVLPITIGMWWVHGLMLLLILGAFYYNSTRQH